MPNHLSILGIIHTALSILAVLIGFYALIKQGMINPKTTPGGAYVFLTILTCVTGFPIMRTGHFGPAHALTIIVIVLLPIGIYAQNLRIFGNRWFYAQVIVMSTTMFLSLVPAVNESLTRLPISQPLAASPDAPLVKMSLLVLFILYLAGITWQVIKLRSSLRVSTSI